MNPANFIWIAAIIGGAVIAWRKFGSKDRQQLVVVSAIGPVQFAVVIFGILFLLVTSAPILGAASFIGTFVRSGHRL